MYKKILRITLLFLITVIFSSCIWIPVSGEEDIRTKTSCKNFSTLNDPIVYVTSALKEFNLYGSENLGTTYEKLGTSYVIYDWETDSVYDYIFVPNDVISYNKNCFASLIKDKNGNYTIMSYANNGRDLFLIDSAGNVSNEKVNKTNTFDNEVGNTYSISNYGLCYYRLLNEDNSGSSFQNYIRFYDADEKKISEAIDVTDKVTGSYFNDSYSDGDGNFWVSYCVKNKEAYNSYFYISKVNFTEKKLEDPIISFDQNEGFTYDINNGWDAENYYKMMGILGNNIFYSKNYRCDNTDTYEYFVLNTLTKEVKKLAWTNDLVGDSYSLVTCGDKNYLITVGPNFVDRKANIYAVNEDLSVSEKPLACKDIEYFPDITVRSNKIYFSGSGYTVSGAYEYMIYLFDTTKNEFSKEKQITHFGELK